MRLAGSLAIFLNHLAAILHEKKTSDQSLAAGHFPDHKDEQRALVRTSSYPQNICSTKEIYPKCSQIAASTSRWQCSRGDQHLMPSAALVIADDNSDILQSTSLKRFSSRMAYKLRSFTFDLKLPES
jgi:hypothetical protein